ncbi:YheC/YheD family protein [Neobacillus novalis]|uniref:YheC/YheD family protein n=1 Tax=Neobacillus novalis TaxID=220687 RepID=A0AA95MKB6_9BACI|nr:YheC/YheD family protein [Neobacillus novalis]WHY85492.1 YheC/YheD family protein [Neobacillus novalis]
MSQSLGKLKQSVLLRQSPLTAKNIPETNIYDLGNLLDFMSRYDYVYVKHSTAGQGRGIFKVYKTKDGSYFFNGFTLRGEPIKQSFAAIEDFHQILRALGQHSNYIIQEGIQSLSLNGQPLSIRSHVQNLNGKWIIGGMFGKIGLAETIDHGIANTHRGAQIISMDELLSVYLQMDDTKKDKVIDSLRDISISTAIVIASQFPCREYGIDIGLNSHEKPIIFEVNTTPGISGFARIENKVLWNQIMKIRKLQKEADS